MKVWKIQNRDFFLTHVLDTNEEKLKHETSVSNKIKYYERKIEIGKKNGTRLIYDVDHNMHLYTLQRNIARNFFENIQLSDVAYGFVKGYSYLDFLSLHKDFYGRKNYLRLDLKDFFGSISSELVKSNVEYYIDEDCVDREKILREICEIVLYNGKLVQGTPVSPVISNLVFRKTDIRIQKYCQKCKVEYSRYADDLLFSSVDKKIFSRRFISGISKIVNEQGFKINYDKVVRGKKNLVLNGFVVSDDIRISRKKLKKIRMTLFFIENEKEVNKPEFIQLLNDKIKIATKDESNTFSNVNVLINYLLGMRSFLISVTKCEDEINATYTNLINIINRIEKQVERLSNK